MVSYSVFALPSQNSSGVDAGHQSGLSVDGVGQVLVGDVPGRNQLQGIKNVILRVTIQSKIEESA